MSKKLAYVLWAWGSTILFAGLIYWLATIPNFDVKSDPSGEVIKVLFRMLLYAVLFILVYRSIIATLKTTVSRLSAWRSRDEAIEDAEFVLIIETLVVIISILATILFSVFEEGIQNFVEGRHAEIKDVLVSVMAVLLTSIVVYSAPVIGELEVAIKHKLDRERHHLRK
jgi:hypothetical protein